MHTVTFILMTSSTIAMQSIFDEFVVETLGQHGQGAGDVLIADQHALGHVEMDGSEIPDGEDPAFHHLIAPAGRRQRGR